MKNITKIITVIFLLIQVSIQSQEKKIPFKKGVLKICSSKNFQIKGYDGKEVIIKSLHKYRRNAHFFTARKVIFRSFKNDSFKKGNHITYPSNNIFRYGSNKQKKGLKKLGKKSDADNGIYLKIEQKNGELLLYDITDNEQFVMVSGESYKIMVPNTLKLIWDATACNNATNKNKVKSENQVFFYNSKVSSLSYFKGEVEISSSLNNLKLKDVTGPVSINSLGGNVKIIFDETLPQKLYSVYTNNGYIDVTFPQSSNILVDAKASEIYSNLNFKVLSEKDVDGIQEMKLKLKSGKVKMKLNTGLGSIYLRKN